MDEVAILERVGIRFYRQYGDEYACYCPTHDDKSPSFFVNFRKGKYICHAGCGAGKLEDLLDNSFLDALQNETVEAIVARLTASITFESSTKVYDLSWRKKYKLALDSNYLLSRKINNATIRKFEILTNAFRSRYFFPVYFNNQEIGYIIGKLNNKPKYQNSPGLPSKHFLYPEFAFERSHDDSVILVEGVFDAIYMHQLGYTNTLALLGTNISNERIYKLASLTENVVLCLDSDEAGQFAIKKFLPSLLQAGLNIKAVNLAPYKDINEIPSRKVPEILNNTIDLGTLLFS